MRTLPGPALARGNAVVATLLVVVGQFEIWSGLRIGGIGAAAPPRLPEALAVLAGTLPLLVRRRFPLPAAAATGLALAAQALLFGRVSLLAGLVPLLVVVYSVAVHASGRLRVLGLPLGGVVLVAFVLGIPEERVPGEWLFGVLVLAGSWTVGHLVRQRQQSADTAADALRRLESERDLATQQALADERAAIARELHDVISHGVSVMGVLAGGARVLVDGDPEQAKAACRRIEAQARESVGELQRLLGVLREADDVGDRAPQPGLHQLGVLVDQMRQAGLPVAMTVEGERPPLPAGLDLAAYRVVQEALTNVLKHAGPVPTGVVVRYEPSAVAVEVRDSGAAPDPGPNSGSSSVADRLWGHGLLGMQERIGLYGGTLLAGRAPSGGFAVRARIPLQEGP